MRLPSSVERLRRPQIGKASRSQLASGYDDSIPEFSVKLIVNRSDVPPVSTFPVLSQPADQGWLHEISGRETPHSPRRVFGCIVIM